MRDLFLLSEVLFHRLIDRSDLLSRGQAGFQDGAFTDRLMVQIAKDLGHPLQRYEVILAEIHHLRLETRPILHRLAHSGWKLGFVHLSAVWAILDLGLVLGHFDLYRRQVKDLPPFMPFHWNTFQGSLAVMAAPDPVNLDMIGLGSHLQRVPLVTGLPATFLATRFSETAIARLPEPITGRRFATVAAVLGQLVFQGLYPFFQSPKNTYPVVYQSENQFNHRIFALSNNGADFLFRGQSQGLHALILTDLRDFDNGKVQQAFMPEQLPNKFEIYPGCDACRNRSS